MTEYDVGYDTFTLVVDDETDIDADLINSLCQALYSLQHALGLNPRGDYDTLVERIEALEELAGSL